jgi:hypothetical protein
MICEKDVLGAYSLEVERGTHNSGVTGSNPVGPTKMSWKVK